MGTVPKNLHPSQFLTTAILIAAAIANAAETAGPAPPQYGPKFSVHRRVDATVWNGASNWSLMMTECKSKDDDMGFKFVGNGTAYSWSFHPNLAGTTLFSCVLRGEHGRLGFKAYDYRRDYDSARCVAMCKWNATRDGVRGFNERTRSYDLFFPWKK